MITFATRLRAPAALVLLLALCAAGGRAHAAPLGRPAGSTSLAPALHPARCPLPGRDPLAALRTAGTPAGSVYEGSIQSAALHGRARSYEIYLPPGYLDPGAAARRYPVIYLLHGAPGGPLDWLCSGNAAVTADMLIRTGGLPPVILVMPDGNGGPLRDTEYVDKFNGRDNEMQYLARDVVAYIDAHYRTRADARDRALAGFSEGGYGAINVGLHYPAEFGTLASLSGYFVALRSEVFGPNDPFGHGRAFQLANSPYDYAATVPGIRRMRLLIVDSTNNLPYTRYAQQFHARLAALQVPHTFLLLQPWHGATAHSWTFLNAQFPTVLRALEGR